MMNKDWPDVTPGSIIAFTGRATRGSEGETREIFALVMSQDDYDGSLTCFAFHFEGQFQAVLQPVTRTPVRGADGQVEKIDVQPTFRMVFDAGRGAGEYDGEIGELRQQMTEFMTQVLEMVTSDKTQTGGDVPPLRVDSTRKTK